VACDDYQGLSNRLLIEESHRKQVSGHTFDKQDASSARGVRGRKHSMAELPSIYLAMQVAQVCSNVRVGVPRPDWRSQTKINSTVHRPCRSIYGWAIGASPELASRDQSSCIRGSIEYPSADNQACAYE